jgi:hypothetical protein
LFKPPPKRRRTATVITVTVAAMALGYVAAISGWLLSLW